MYSIEIYNKEEWLYRITCPDTESDIQMCLSRYASNPFVTRMKWRKKCQINMN